MPQTLHYTEVMSSGRAHFLPGEWTHDPGIPGTPAQPGPGIVVIQEWWGLVSHIERVADRFALAGFVALAPDLYHGEKATTPDQAGR